MQPQRDLVIIGAGAAGLSAAQYAAEAGIDALVIEEMAAGGQSLLINKLDNYPGFPDPISGVEFAMKLEKQTRNAGIPVAVTRALSVQKENGRFIVETLGESVSALAVILAGGAKQRRLGVPGEEEFSGKGVSYCASCDGPFFKNRKILVVGGGDSACDEALYLSGLSEKVALVHRRERLRARPASARRVLNNPRISLLFNTLVEEIHGQQKVQYVTLKDSSSGKTFRRDTDGVFICTGSIPRSEVMPGVTTDEEGHVVTNRFMETDIEGLYAAGEVRNTPFRQIIIAAGEGATAALSAARYIASLKGEIYEG